MMINNVEEYLIKLKEELSGSDPATIQDVLTDAEEHLRTALNGLADSKDRASEGEALASIIEKYGTPEEVAVAYREIERYSTPAFDTPASYREKEPPETLDEIEPEEPVFKDTRPLYTRFFGIVIDPRAWGALLFLFIAFGTGIIYFTWVVTGVSLSAGLLVLIIGLPFAALFLLSVWGISLAEGRIVEALLGIRMPRRPRYYRKKMGWWPRLKTMMKDKYTWLSVVYMLLQFPLGVFYFCLFVVLIASSLFGIAWPILQASLNYPFFQISGIYYHLTGFGMFLTVVGGALLFIITMHLAKFFGQLHGKMAKAMLVRI
jgi:uncharacterized membrane protein